MSKLRNKTAIITGGGGGIGGATCRRFATEGAKVAVFDMNLAAAEKVAQEIVANGGTASAFACDITDRSQVDAAVAASVGGFVCVSFLSAQPVNPKSRAAVSSKGRMNFADFWGVKASEVHG